jgi:hypothetical protein
MDISYIEVFSPDEIARHAVLAQKVNLKETGCGGSNLA